MTSPESCLAYLDRTVTNIHGVGQRLEVIIEQM